MHGTWPSSRPRCRPPNSLAYEAAGSLCGETGRRANEDAAWPSPPRAVVSACTVPSIPPGSCRRWPGGSTIARSCGRAKLGSTSRCSRSTRCCCGACAMRCEATTAGFARGSSRPSPSAASSKTPSPVPVAHSWGRSQRSDPTIPETSPRCTGRPALRTRFYTAVACRCRHLGRREPARTCQRPRHQLRSEPARACPPGPRCPARARGC